MTADFHRENPFATAITEISVLPAHKRIDALLDIFVSVIDSMDAGAISELRDQIMARFSTCGCTFETSRLMIEFINGHLALRKVTGSSHANSSS